MRAIASLLAACLIVANVSGHGWMEYPVPRSGGTGTGTASTSGPCGQGSSTAATATFKAGASVTANYANANGHGVTGNTVNLTLSFIAGGRATTNAPNPQTADFTVNETAGVFLVANSAQMAVPGTNPQSTTFSIPNGGGFSGLGVLQFKWSATDGSHWYDCAYVNVLDAGATTVCTTNNGGCDPNAQCTGVTTATCTCNPGFYGNGTVGNCNTAASAVSIVLTVSNPNPPSQDTFTTQLATMLQTDTRFHAVGDTQTWSVSRINYDHAASDGQGNYMIYFQLLPDKTTGESGLFAAQRLQAYAAQNDYSTGVQLGFPSQLVSATVTYVGPGGTGSSGSASSSSNAGAIAAGVLVPVFVIGVVVAVVLYRRRTAGSSTGSKAAPPSSSFRTSSSPVAQGATAVPTGTFQRYAAPAPVVPARPGAKALPAGWSKYSDDQGMPYFYNEQTGESRWDEPTN